MPRKPSLVWKYFKKLSKGKYLHGECQFCKKTYLSNPKRMEKHLIICKKAPELVRNMFTEGTETDEQAEEEMCIDQKSDSSRSTSTKVTLHKL